MPIRDTYANAVLHAGPLAFWRLGESSGTSAADTGGNGRTGTYSGSPTLGAAGAVGDGNTAVTFDGVNDYLSAAHASTWDAMADAFTVECWVTAPAATGARRRLFGKGPDASEMFGLYFEAAADTLRVEVHRGGAQRTATSSAAVAGAGWVHVAVTWDGTDLRIYLNGALDSTTTPAGSGSLTPNTDDINIGRDPGGSNWFAGTLDEVAFYSRVLNAAEIADHYASRLIAVNQKALMYSRSGVARSGATRSDYFNEMLKITVNGTDRSANILKGTMSVRKRLGNQTDTASFRSFGWPPVAGQEVIIGNGSISNRIFGGVAIRVRQLSVKAVGGTPVKEMHDVSCGDWTFVLAKERVLEYYESTYAHLIFLDLASKYAPAGFTTANVKTTSPLVDEIAFDLNTTLPGAFTQLANRVGWRWKPDAFKDLHFTDAETLQSPTPITATNLLYNGLDYETAVSQVRTRVIVEGGGGKATAPVAVGATTIPVDECGWYAGAGGTVKSGNQRVTYTGRSATSGPGDLTGVPAAGAGSVVRAIRQGDGVQILVTADDAAAQITMASLIPSSVDGIFTFFYRNHSLSTAGATERAESELAMFPPTLEAGGFVSRDKFVDVGRQQLIVLPGRNINLSVPIQEVEIRWLNPARTERRARFDSSVRIDLADVVRSIGEQA